MEVVGKRTSRFDLNLRHFSIDLLATVFLVLTITACSWVQDHRGFTLQAGAGTFSFGGCDQHSPR
jgi:hypothetical protein